MATPIPGGMPDTMEYFTMFHMALEFEGVVSMLINMVLMVLMMLMALAQYDRMIVLIDECIERRSN